MIKGISISLRITRNTEKKNIILNFLPTVINKKQCIKPQVLMLSFMEGWQFLLVSLQWLNQFSQIQVQPL